MLIFKPGYNKPRLAKPNRKAHSEKSQLALSEAQQALAEQAELAAARAEQQSLQQQSRELLASKREQEQVLAALARHAYINRKDNALKKPAQCRKPARGCPAAAVHALSVRISARPD